MVKLITIFGKLIIIFKQNNGALSRREGDDEPQIDCGLRKFTSAAKPQPKCHVEFAKDDDLPRRRIHKEVTEVPKDDDGFFTTTTQRHDDGRTRDYDGFTKVTGVTKDDDDFLPQRHDDGWMDGGSTRRAELAEVTEWERGLREFFSLSLRRVFVVKNRHPPRRSQEHSLLPGPCGWLYTLKHAG